MARRKRRSRFLFNEIPLILPTTAGNSTNAECMGTSKATRRRIGSPEPSAQKSNRSDVRPAEISNASGFCDFDESDVIQRTTSIFPHRASRDEQLDEYNDQTMEPTHEICQEEDDLALDVMGSVPEEETLQPTKYLDGTGSMLEISSWRVLWSLIMTNGSRRLTKDQYQSIRVFSEAVERSSRNFAARGSLFVENCTSVSDTERKLSYLPHYSTLSKVWRPILFRKLVPRYRDYMVPVDTRKAGMQAERFAADRSQTSVRVVFPSEYARLDIATPGVFDAICATSISSYRDDIAFSAECPSIAATECVDLLPLVAAREWFYGPPEHVSVDSTMCSGPYVHFAEIGDSLQLSSITTTDLDESLARCFVILNADAAEVTMEGEIVHVWIVHHETRKSIEDFKDNGADKLAPRDKAIATVFNFVSYISATDGADIEIPEIPVDSDGDFSEADASASTQTKNKSARTSEACRRRNSALKRRQNAIQAAWRDWRKPILKPGDTIALLKPTAGSRQCGTLLTSTDRQSRLLLVNRFWVQNEERSRHVLWIPGGRELTTRINTNCNPESHLHSLCAPLTNSNIYLPIKRVTLTSVHHGRRGPLKYRPVSSLGTLSNGEKYCVYRFLLFWDGFEVQKGKASSADGVYIISLNIPPQARNSSASVRVISLAPPGVKSDAILARIIDDIVDGMTTGFVDIDATGTKRRIFLDLVGILGDTPALNAALDILGHSGAACCHLCRFVRKSSTMVGSRFTAPSHNASISCSARSYYTHAAVRDCGAKGESLRLLGMKTDLTSSNTILHVFRERIRGTEGKVVLTSDGVPVVPSFFDPYRCCLVAPDHLLTGHIRDCVNLAFRLLPTQNYRKTCEGHMLGLLRDCSLPAQNRLLDNGKKSLYSMSMTELYALAVVAGRAFEFGCAREEAISSSSSMTERCKLAISLVNSVSNLVAQLWFKFDKRLDGSDAVHTYKENFGYSYLQRIQALTDKHISGLEHICRMSDDNFANLEDTNTPKSRRIILERDYKSCVLAIKTVDRPNVHRLRELVYSTLPMLGHVSVFGELALEKAHQGLKRAILRSNNKTIQLQSVQSTLFDDWQGRLTMSVPLVVQGDNDSIRACFRLLAGREPIISMQGIVPAAQQRRVRELFGPGSNIFEELKTQGKTVLSSSYLPSATVSWKLRVPIESYPDGRTDASEPVRKSVLSLLKTCFPSDWALLKIEFSASVTTSLPNGSPRISIKRGQILQVVTLGTADSEHHFPFVVQSKNLSLPVAEHSSLWCVQDIFSLRKPSFEVHYYATVSPCVEETWNSSSSRSIFRALSLERISLLHLDAHVRLVQALHVCNPLECSLNAITGEIRHSTFISPQQGSQFLAITRLQGYPPRSG